jgi:adenosylcobinamide-GDP ribazoletransferase
MSALIAALQFLLITPAFVRRPFTASEMGQSVAFYPLVGLLLGALLAGVDALLAYLWPVPVRSALVLALWVILTGGLHLDGFLDSCDGLLGGFTRESRMEIMRDERVGAYALAGGVLLLITMYSGLSSIAAGRWAVLLLAPLFGRWSISLAVTAHPYARQSGLGRDIKDHAHAPQLSIASLTTLLAASILAFVLHSPLPLIGLVVAAVIFWLSSRFIVHQIGGMTGDTYGAINMLVEAATLLVFAAIH